MFSNHNHFQSIVIWVCAGSLLHTEIEMTKNHFATFPKKPENCASKFSYSLCNSVFESRNLNWNGQKPSEKLDVAKENIDFDLDRSIRWEITKANCCDAAAMKFDSSMFLSPYQIKSNSQTSNKSSNEWKIMDLPVVFKLIIGLPFFPLRSLSHSPAKP